MAKPIVHAESSARKWGDKAEDYLFIHQKMDSTKSAHGSNRHRVVFHSAAGIFLLEDIFGKTFVNSAGGTVHVRDVGEQHVMEDLGFIPDLGDYLAHMTLEPWMCGAAKTDKRLGPPKRLSVLTAPHIQGSRVMWAR